LKKREAPADTKLACLVLEDPRSVALGSEPVRIDGDVVGRVTSGGYGYTVAHSIAYAYIPTRCPIDTPVEVDIFGTWIAGRVAKVGHEPHQPQGGKVALAYDTEIGPQQPPVVLDTELVVDREVR